MPLPQNIYNEGATRLFVFGLLPFGCVPSQITLHNLTGNTCIEEYNDVAVSFNKRTASLLETIKPRFPGLKIAVINIYDKLLDMIKNPSKYGNILLLSDSFTLNNFSTFMCTEC